MNDKDIITLNCPECKNKFTLTYGRYRRFPKDHKFLCSSCWKKHLSTQFKEKTEKERKQWNLKMQEGNKNRTSEQKAATAAKVSAIKKEFWSNMSEENRKNQSERIKESLRNRTDEQKTEWRQNISNAQKDVWGSLTLEERKEKMQALFEGSREYWDNITPEELEQNHRLVSKGLKQYFATADPEVLRKRWKKIGLSTKLNWEKLSDTEKISHMQKMWSAFTPSSIGPTEYQFIDVLKKYGLHMNIDFAHGFNTFDIGYIHPEYFNIFGKINPVSKSENYPYHTWDFCIYTKNGPMILIDIDGSIHNLKDPSMVKSSESADQFSLRDFIAYNDSKRPYMIPPGFIGYVIKCYDDILDDTCPVYKVTYDESKEFPFKDFVPIIQLSQIPNKEMYKLMNV